MNVDKTQTKIFYLLQMLKSVAHFVCVLNNHGLSFRLSQRQEEQKIGELVLKLFL